MASDFEALKKAFRFVRPDNDVEDEHGNTGYEAMAKAFEAKLFREFAVADLSRSERSMIGLRWRTARECQSGKGETSCGALECRATEDLSCFELPFTYREGPERAKKTTLVKLKVCPLCAKKVACIAENGSKGKKSKKNKKKREKREKREKRNENVEELKDGLTGMFA